MSMFTNAPHALAIFGAPSWVEILVILVVVLLFFGKRIPNVARSLGQGIVEFRKGLKDPPADDVSDDVTNLKSDAEAGSQTSEAASREKA